MLASRLDRSSRPVRVGVPAQVEAVQGQVAAAGVEAAAAARVVMVGAVVLAVVVPKVVAVEVDHAVAAASRRPTMLTRSPS